VTDPAGEGSGDARRTGRAARPTAELLDSFDAAAPPLATAARPAEATSAASPARREPEPIEEYEDFRRWLVSPDPHQPLRARWDPTGADEGGPRSSRPARKKLSRLGRFVAAYGWRAYALPVLMAVTAVVGVDAVRGVGHAAHRTISPANAIVDDAGFGEFSDVRGAGVIGVPPKDAGNLVAEVSTGALPDGGPFTAAARGTWHVVGGATGQTGRGVARVFTYTVEIEDGVDTSGFGGDEAFAELVDKTLADPKSWTRDARFAFRRVDRGSPTFRVSLSSPRSARRACGFGVGIDMSCFNQDLGRVVLDEARWVRGAAAFQGDVGSYRQYMINHEVGHAIGYHQQQPCRTDGGPAPVMMRQTFGVSDNDIARLDPGRLDPAGVVPMDGKVCRVNPWPYPRG